MRSARWIVLGALAALLGAAHGQTFNLYAAASLKEPAKEMAAAFEKRYPNFRVAVTLAGSQQLAAQIKRGAPADVLLSAGMEPLKGLSFEPSSMRIFAYNTLAIVVPANSRSIQSVRDLAKVYRIIIADHAVPAGHYTDEVFAKATKLYGQAWRRSVDRHTVSREHDVRSVLAKVSIGEADAGIVYTTDGIAGGNKVRVVPIADELNIEATYPAVRFAQSPNADLAKDFMRFLFEKEAQKALVNHGFASPIIPGSSIQLTISGKPTLLTARRIHALQLRTFTASEHGVLRNFHGYDIVPMLNASGGAAGSMKVSAGDGYSQTVDLTTALKEGAFLVDSAHDNFQLILPSMPPKYWVHWVREIVVH